jgi:hypothetical protein
VREPYVLSVKAKRPNELKKLVRQAIMNEFWTRTLKHAAKFPGRGIVAHAENKFPSLTNDGCFIPCHG